MRLSEAESHALNASPELILMIRLGAGLTFAKALDLARSAG
jgi:hypothetical protein